MVSESGAAFSGSVSHGAADMLQGRTMVAVTGRDVRFDGLRVRGCQLGR